MDKKTSDPHLLELSLSGPGSAGQTRGLMAGGHSGQGGGRHGMIPGSQASPASSVPLGCVTGAKGLCHISLSLQLYRMGLFAHPRPTQSALFEAQGLWAPSGVVEPRHGEVPTSCGPLFPSWASFSFFSKTWDHVSTLPTREGVRNFMKESTKSSQHPAMGNPEVLTTLLPPSTLGSSETKTGPRAPPCGDWGYHPEKPQPGAPLRGLCGGQGWRWE